MTRLYGSLPVRDVTFTADVERGEVDVPVRVEVQYVMDGVSFLAVEVLASHARTGESVELTDEEVARFSVRAADRVS